MKKWLALIVGVLVLCVAAIYIFIPGTLYVSDAVKINCPQRGVERFFSEKNNWTKWWPQTGNGKQNATAGIDSGLVYNDYIYKITRGLFQATGVQIEKDDFKTGSIINIMPLTLDSCEIQWQCTLSTGLNPIKRLQQYMQAGDIKNNMDDLLDTLQSFAGKTENVYNLSIELKKVTDTLLVAAKKVFISYPTDEEIYGLIKTLQDFIVKNGVKETHYPMLHVTKDDDSDYYEAMVALPINTAPKVSGNIYIKRMPPGKILVTNEIRGGPITAKTAIANFEAYVNDYKLLSPAIWYESLITDRLAEPDTTKWVTQLYYPIF